MKSALLRWSITLFFCLLLFALLAAFKYFQVQAMIAFGKSFPEPSESVEVVTAQTRDVETQIKTIGEIVAPREIVLKNELEGRIVELSLVPGSKVNKGDLLVQLDISEEQARLEAAKAQVNLTSLELKRVERLVAKNSISEDELDQARANATVAKADVAALESVIAKKTMVAPFDAVVGLHTLEVGEYLSGNSDLVSLLGVTDYLWVDFDLPLSKATQFTGDQVFIELPGITEQPVAATVIARDSIASAESRNITLRAKLEGDYPIAPNTVVRVDVPTGVKHQVALPRTALSVDLEHEYVWVLQPDNSSEGFRAEKREVTLDYRDNNSVVVSSGLAAGDLVVSKGGFKLTPNLLTFIRQRPDINYSAPDENADTHNASEPKAQ